MAKAMKILELAVTYHWYDEIESGRKKEKDHLIMNMQRVGCTDIKPYLREIKQYVPDKEE